MQWTAILTNRGGWKTNKKLLKSCQTSEYQYASVNCTQFWWVDSSSLFQAFNYLGRSAKHDARKKGAETRRGKSRKFVQSLFISPSFSISKVLVIPTASRKRIKHFFSLYSFTVFCDLNILKLWLFLTTQSTRGEVASSLRTCTYKPCA